MKTRTMLGISFTILLISTFALVAQKDAKSDTKKLSALMQKKLVHSQKVLEGIAVKNFATIEKSAEELMAISKATEWRVLKTVRYQMYSNQFRRSIETLQKNAKEKNLDAAALTYVDLTLTCVNCHKHVREVRRASVTDKFTASTNIQERNRP